MAIITRVETDDRTVPGPAAHPSPRDPSRLATRVLPMAVLGCLMAAMVRLAATPLDNPDTFFHLRFGAEFLDGWSLRHPGSPTTAGTADWLPTQWSAQVLMASLERAGGLSAVAWLAGLQYVALVLVVFLVARRWSDPVVAATLTVVVTSIAAPGLSMRPQVFSYVAAAVVTAAWLGLRRSARTPWWLVPLTYVWATYHGMWPVAIVIGLVACAGLALEGSLRGPRLRRALAVPLLSAVAASLTPVGPGLWGAVLEVSSRGQYFSEWAAPDFTSIQPAILLVLLALTTVPMLRSGPTPWGDLLLLGLAGAFAVYSARTVPVSAVVVLPLAAARLQELVGRASRPVAGVERWVPWAMAASCLVVLALLVPHTSARPAPQPAWVAPSLDALAPGTRLLGNGIYGGVLMWQQPDLDVVLSGYGDVYTDAEMKRNATVEDAADGWVEDVHELGATYALVGPDSTLAYALTLQGWTTVERSDSVELLAAPADW